MRLPSVAGYGLCDLKLISLDGTEHLLITTRGLHVATIKSVRDSEGLFTARMITEIRRHVRLDTLISEE